MKYEFNKLIVISLGGSIVFPDQINTVFLKKFNLFIREFVKQDFQFVIVVGGGKICRNYQAAAHQVSRVNDEDKDWIGIHATRLNAHLLRTIFRDLADPVIFDNLNKIKKLKFPISIASGWRPGWSTDYVSARIADHFKVKEFVNAGKPAHVYEKDPQKFPMAKKFNQITWTIYRKLIPDKWKPGLNSPIDPVAAKFCENRKIKAIVINGKNLKNFENLLKGREFQGTIIE